ncbi:MAG TPA: tetratricopeptide repeat protein [Gammaproteobacteria bacterium]|nr:tetratricopeptide repeat protein [Gammaproteobacteria bacterium]
MMTEMKYSQEKSLWQQHGKWVLALFVLFLFSYAGMQFYNHYQSKRALKASMVYDKLLSLSQKPDKTEATQTATALIAQYPKTPYAPLAALLLAKFSFEADNLEATTTHLNFAIKAEGPAQPIARVRLARVLIDQKKPEEALALLTEKKVPEGFVPMFEETKGDIYLMQNDKVKARVAYQTAIEAAEPGVPITRLQLKQADLGKTINLAD